MTPQCCTRRTGANTFPCSVCGYTPRLERDIRALHPNNRLIARRFQRALRGCLTIPQRADALVRLGDYVELCYRLHKERGGVDSVPTVHPAYAASPRWRLAGRVSANLT